MFQPSMKYLGLIFDQRLRWKEQINDLKIRCNKAMDILKCLSRTSWGGDRTTLLRLYKALIRSKLDYASFVYWTASENILSKLDPVHNTAIRICLGAFKSSPIISLYAESGEMSLKHRRNQLALQYYSRCQQTPESPIYNLVTNHHQQYDKPDTYTFFEKFNSIADVIRTPTIPVIHLTDPIWTLPEILCDGFSPPPKRESTPELLKNLFLTHVEEHHINSKHIYTDGSKQENKVGCSVITDTIRQNKRLNDNGCIFTAELTAILMATEVISQDQGIAHSTIFCDSQSAIKVLNSSNPSHPIVCSILHNLIDITRDGRTVSFCWVPGHVGIQGNERADEAAKQALTLNITQANTYFKDYFPEHRNTITNHWRQEWNSVTNNILRSIKPVTKVWKSSKQQVRKNEVVLCRLRIGHTRLTHGHYMERQNRPFCDDCLVATTYYHCLLYTSPSPRDKRQSRMPSSA